MKKFGRVAPHDQRFGRPSIYGTRFGRSMSTGPGSLPKKRSQSLHGKTEAPKDQTVHGMANKLPHSTFEKDS